ncbi:GDSL esterase/lipase At1g28580-like [Miscanthus floridulus]|uniref:GDSL esterase/lipase At1g28580-like n=1 Tax=Miscanthus floridulus TaxID=154761 RepID=UPI00345A6C9C
MASRRRGFSAAYLPVLVLVCLAAAAVSGEPLPQYYDAIFSFGDSFSDTGNFVIINSGKLPNMPKFPPPYARCSNGRLVIDFLAEAFGLPLLPPSANKGTNFSQGANFAVMGATALDLQYFKDNNVWSIPPFNTSMNVQLEWFQEVKQTICPSDPSSCRALFGKSLFVFGEFGGNDYSFAWKADWSLEKVKTTLVPAVVASLVSGVERLLDEGARHVVVPGNLPAGCIPITLTMYLSEDRSEYDPRTGCLKKYNSVALYHNAMLRIALDRLQRRRPESRIVYADYYTPYIQFARTPHLYGYKRGALRACCGGGGPYNYNMSASCGLPGATTCEDPDAHVSWDGIHLTEAPYRFIANTWVKGPYAHPPLATVVLEDMVD